MGDITRSNAGLDPVRGATLTPVRGVAGVDGIVAGVPCFLDSNGLIQKSVNTVVGPTGTYFGESKFDGMPARTIASGTVGELYGLNAIFNYGTGLTIGAFYDVSSNVGQITDTLGATDRPIAKAISATQIVLLRGV